MTMMKVIAYVMKWTPGVLEGLYYDNADHSGLIFWYDFAKEIMKETKGWPQP